MANRQFRQFQYTLENKVVHLFAKVTIGGSGAPTLSTADSRGIASVSRSSAGLYVITMQDAYQKLFCINTIYILASGAPAVVTTPVVRAVSPLSAKTVTVGFLNGSGTATDPDNGAVLQFHLVLGDSTA
jgi:hypothetical protein